MRRVVVFDFDGTLTRKDTFLEFIRYTHGTCKLYVGLLFYFPLLLLMKLHLLDNGKVKERVFSHFFHGWRYDVFKKNGEDFADFIERCKRGSVVTLLHTHIIENADVYVISASVEEWVRPWCEHQGVKHVLGTQIEVVGGILTGRFLTKNCYGQEKVRRLLEAEPVRNNYHLTAYGDSRGDKEMLAFADKGHKI